MAITVDKTVPFLDVADPAFSVRSAEVRRAREASWYARTSYGLAVLRHGQVARLIRHPNLRQGSRLWPAHHGVTSGPFADWWASWVLNQEGEAHQRLRRLLNPAFSRRIIDQLQPRFEALAGELADAFTPRGRCEFMSEFAVPYAARVIAILLGIPEEDRAIIAAHSGTVGLAMGVQIREHLPQIEASLAALYGYADALIADRRRSPRGDFVTCLACPPASEEHLSDAELRDSLVLLIFGGFDTTRNQLGLAMQAFIDHPGQWRLLGERPELGPAAVEEVMRVGPTTTWVTREAIADFAFDGLDIPAGTTIHLFCESAGTDPRVAARNSTSPRSAALRTLVSAGGSTTALATLSRGRTCARRSRCSPAASASPASQAWPPRCPTAATPGRSSCRSPSPPRLGVRRGPLREDPFKHAIRLI